MGIHRRLRIPLSNVLVRNIVLSKEFARRFIEINDGVDITGAALSGGGKIKNELAGKRVRQGLAERALGR